MATQQKLAPVNSLSKRECEVLELGARGATDQEISQHLAISVPTLRTYWLRIREKTGGLNRTHAIAIGIAQSLGTAESDPERKLLERARAESAAQWAWRPSDRNVILDGPAKTLFGIAADDTAIPLDRLLGCVWPPDRVRVQRFLLQSSELDPMTPIEYRIGSPGDYRHVVRTVNLSTHRFKKDGVTVLLASAVSRTFS
jgi:DNA-binding CsgD family transcriptional regulator